MKRPTIRDLAEAAGVGVATVNRILAGQDKVREKTRQKVRLAAEEIGFYGLGAIADRNERARPAYHFGILLLQAHRPYYQTLARMFHEEAAKMERARLTLTIEHLEDISPQNTAARLEAISHDCQALAVVSALHSRVSQAVRLVQARGVPVFAIIAPLSDLGQLPFIGVDNWKAGRTAAWMCHHVCKQAGKVGILMGSPRYRNQELNESGFRSYFREHADDFTLIEPRLTFETVAVAHEMTEQLLSEHPDLVALYTAGGSVNAITASIRASGRGGDLVVVGSELTDAIKTAMLDGIVTFSIAHPLRRLVRETLAGMIGAMAAKEKISPFASYTRILPFEIYTAENL